VSDSATAPATACASGSQAVAEALRLACTDPADAIRLLSSLAVFNPPILSSAAPIGMSIATFQTAVGALCRRAALTSLSRAIASYQPTSYNDAQTVMMNAAALFDAEIEVAADAGDLQSYLALRALRTGVVQDMTTRGSSLAQVVTITRPRSMPALALAYQLYGDATRYDDMVQRVNPVHPGFMPLVFEALSF
jgi:prophage DNA circulation protein